MNFREIYDYLGGVSTEPPSPAKSSSGGSTRPQRKSTPSGQAKRSLDSTTSSPNWTTAASPRRSFLSSPHDWIGMVLEEFDLEGSFDRVISADDIDAASKPAPTSSSMRRTKSAFRRGVHRRRRLGERDRGSRSSRNQRDRVSDRRPRRYRSVAGRRNRRFARRTASASSDWRIVSNSIHRTGRAGVAVSNILLSAADRIQLSNVDRPTRFDRNQRRLGKATLTVNSSSSASAPKTPTGTVSSSSRR